MIHFISDGSYVRVDYSAKSGEERLKQLQLGNPNKLTLLTSIDGTLKDKQELHKQMAEHRITGEWFSANTILKKTLGINGVKLELASKTQAINPQVSGTKQESKDELVSNWQRHLMERQGTIGLTNQLAATPEEIQAILELPVYGQSPEVSVAAVNAVRVQQRLGTFYQPAIFCDAILQDSMIYSNMMVRVKALTGQDIIFSPADESDKAREICEDIEHNYSKMCPICEIEEMLRWGLLLGVSIQQVMWDSTSISGKWLPVLKTFHPKNLSWNYGWYQFALTTTAGYQAILPEDIQWNLFYPYTDHLPWQRGMVLPLAMLWLMRNCNEQWWSQHQERNGQGLLVAITSAEATPAQEKVFANQLYNLQSAPVVRAPQGTEGNKFDVRREDPASDLYLGFKEMLDYIDRRIAMVCVGQDKTTMAKTSGMTIGGADAGEMVRLDLMRSDNQMISNNLREKIFKLYIKYNYGEEFMDLAPYMNFDVEPEEDIKTRGEALQTFSDAVIKLMQMPGAEEIDFRSLRQMFKIPMTALAMSEPDVPGYYSHIERARIAAGMPEIDKQGNIVKLNEAEVEDPAEDTGEPPEPGEKTTGDKKKKKEKKTPGK